MLLFLLCLFVLSSAWILPPSLKIRAATQRPEQHRAMPQSTHNTIRASRVAGLHAAPKGMDRLDNKEIIEDKEVRALAGALLRSIGGFLKRELPMNISRELLREVPRDRWRKGGRGKVFQNLLSSPWLSWCLARRPDFAFLTSHRTTLFIISAVQIHPAGKCG